MENTLVILPEEVKSLAERVSEEKRQEVQTVLAQVFSGTSDWKKQVDAIEVKDINDTMSIQLADTARKNAKTARINAEKIFDAKRAEVQSKMQDYKTEDALWLKAKQTMQILFSDIEKSAEYKAKFRERYMAEQKELRTQQRLVKVSKYPEVTREQIENLTDETFNILLSGLEKDYNDKIEAERKAEEERKEAERKAELYRTRKDQLIPFWNLLKEDHKSCDFGELPQESFDIMLREVKGAKENYDKKQEEDRIERLRLQKENEEKEKQLTKERAEADKKRKELEEKARKEREAAAAKLKAEQEAKAKLEAQIKAKQEAEKKAQEAALKAKKEAEAKALAEKKAVEEAQRKTQLAPDKDKLIEFAATIKALTTPKVESMAAETLLEQTRSSLARISDQLLLQAQKM